MTLPLKSKQGCWTCRLRKKKCDESRPACSVCTALAITCHGYGARPGWMDDSEAVVNVLEELKGVVKVTSRLKGKAKAGGRGRGPGPEGVVLRPKSGSAGGGGGGELNLDRDGNGNGTSKGALDTSPSIPHGEPGPAAASPPSTASQHSIHGDESILLMHFLDHVFTLQYPLYRPQAIESGRGWLLSALLRSKPLYHAALATSMHHRRTLMLGRLSPSARATALVEQERYLEIAIKAVTEQAANACPAVGLDIMLTVVQLVFFEIFAGNGSGWEPHLRATMSMYDRGYSHDLKPFRLAERSRIILQDDLPLGEEDDSFVSEEVISFRFLTGTIIWLDIVSCITRGTAPVLSSYHPRVLAPDSQVDVGKIMGCRNRIMLQIGRTAALVEQWQQQQIQEARSGTFECKPLRQTAYDIYQEIQCEIAHLAKEDGFVSEADSILDFDLATVPGEDPEMLITRLFACMASIYLRLITQRSFPSSLTSLDESIHVEAMTRLRDRIPGKLLAALVCPLFIIGSIANTESDKQYFRDVFSQAPLSASIYQDRAKILPVLEKIWSRRRVDSTFGWNDLLAIADGVLLL
ncbi:hypothetical protein LTR84_000738 [Exophiala bonariae]|uniref:Zn(2)-C6 fungal-type domain-containing protein n=1 Tax=Exophiala bonariae TaxID=1690606 RepID=A0AAV9NRF8_9EURO|nr:hypothetical protein LTR84_000738 [Exophiala bonariae]